MSLTNNMDVLSCGGGGGSLNLHTFTYVVQSFRSAVLQNNFAQRILINWTLKRDSQRGEGDENPKCKFVL